MTKKNVLKVRHKEVTRIRWGGIMAILIMDVGLSFAVSIMGGAPTQYPAPQPYTSDIITALFIGSFISGLLFTVFWNWAGELQLFTKKVIVHEKP